MRGGGVDIVSWRERIIRWWRTTHWWILGAAALGAVALGFVGFRTYLGAGTRSAWDYLYLSLQLFVLESGGVPGPLPVTLEIARLLAPAVAAYAVVAVAAAVFRDEILGLRTRFRRDHVIICGLEIGWPLARMLRAGNERVVVIERDPAHPRIESARAWRMSVFVGDARDEQVLVTAGVRRARRLVSVCGHDGENMRIAEQARRLSRGRTRLRIRPAQHPLEVLVHVDGPQLAGLLALREMDRSDRGDARVDFFSYYAGGARALLSEYPPVVRSECGDASPHLLIIGLGRLGQQLVVQAAREWQAEEHDIDARLWITVADVGCHERVQELRERHPILRDVCELHDVELPRDPMRLLRTPLSAVSGSPQVSNVFVCLPDDAQGLGVGLSLHRSLRHHGTPVVVRTYDEDLAALLFDAGDRDPDGLYVFAQLDRACRPDRLFAGVNEVLARGMHDTYLRQQHQMGKTAETNPSMVEWDLLPKAKQDSNREQAEHVKVKLAAVGCEIGPLTDPDADLFAFTHEEVELLGEMEHDRWASAADPANPLNVPWDQLSDEMQEIDRNFVRRLPAMLAAIGFQITRLDGNATAGS